MELTKLGWNAELNQQFAFQHAKGLVPARVAVEDKHFFRVWTTDGELLAQVSGKVKRNSPADITLFESQGIGIEDVAGYAYVLRKAREVSRLPHRSS